MKIKAKIIIICLMIMLCPILRADADSIGYLVKFKDGYFPDAVKYELEEINAEKGIYSTASIDSLKPVADHIEYTSIDRPVSLIDGDEAVAPLSLPEDELYSEQWQLQLINADSSWKLETYGNDIKVAVIDSGCYAHEDLKNNLLEGKNYLTGTNDVTDTNGHGTHISGIIAAEMNGIGISGVAPKAKIVPLKCFDASQNTYVKDILQAIYDAVDVYNCRIINMSWGIKTDDPFLKEAIDYADSKDVILVAAVGNYSSGTLYYPAAYENVIGVSSVGMDKSKSPFSQYNNSVLVTASGEKVKSTYNDGSYKFLTGTSQAAPQVCGVAAVALSVSSDLTSAQFRHLLTDTAEDLGNEGYDTDYGYGLVDENALLNKLLQDTEYYVSPVNTTDAGSYVLIKNNTDNVLNALSIFAEYQEKKFIGCVQKELILLPDKEIILTTESKSNSISYFLWENSEFLTPIIPKITIK